MHGIHSEHCRLAGTDSAKALAVRVAGTKTGYTAVTKSSPSTAAVAAGSLGPAPVPTLTVTVAGTKTGYTTTEKTSAATATIV